MYITSIGLILPQVCASLKPGPEFPSAYSLGHFYFQSCVNDLRTSRIDVVLFISAELFTNHYLNFLSMIGKCVIQTLIININRIRLLIFSNIIFVQFDGIVFQHEIGIPMGTNSNSNKHKQDKIINFFQQHICSV